MKIECIYEKLNYALAVTSRSAGKHATLPVLNCIVISAKDNEVCIKATNLEIGVEISFNSKVDVPGTVAVPGGVFLQLVNSLDPKEIVKIELIGTNLKVSSGKTHSLVKTLPAEDFPNIPRVTDATECTVSGKDIALGISTVSFSASVSNVKPELSSVYIYPDDGNLVFAATDSFRLAEKKLKADYSESFSAVIVPIKNAQEIARVFSITSDDVVVKLGKNQISLESKGVYLVSRVIDGVYPDYRQVIPKTATTECVVSKDELVHSLKVTTIFSDKFNQVNVSVNSKDSLLSFKTKNNDVGETERSIEAYVNGDDVSVNFNQKYITDSMSVLEGDKVKFSFNGPSRPLVITSHTDPNFTYLVMPMNR